MAPLEKIPVLHAKPVSEEKRWEEIVSLIDRDNKAIRNEYFFETPGFVTKWLDTALRDKRDKPMVFLVYNMTLIILPLACLVVYFSSWWMGALYYMTIFSMFECRFCLLLHFSSHRQMFKEQYGFMNYWIPCVLCNFFGLPPGVYYLHHCVMHHVENNVFPWDVSSTEPFQRDNFFHFLFYWMRFTFAIWVELPYYAFIKGRTTLLTQCLAVSACHLSFVYFFFSINFVAAFWLCGVPFLVTSFALMFGNWSQHIFIEPAMATEGTGKERRAHFRHSYNVLNSPYNQMTFNDGYHVEHHINSQRHWSELPSACQSTLAEYDKENALLFKNIDFFLIGVYVMLGWYSELFKNFVDVKNPKRSEAEIKAMLLERLKPIRRKNKPTK